MSCVESVWSAHRKPTAKRFGQQLVQTNLHLVKQEAYRAKGLCREPLEDLVQEGRVGLLKAAQRFDATQGEFQPFARRCIRGEIQHYLRDKGWGAVKPPRRWVEGVATVRRYQRQQVAAGRALSEVDAATECGFSQPIWDEMVAVRGKICDSFPEEFEVPAPEANSEFVEVNQCVDRLPEPLKSCVVERYFHQASLRTLAQQHGVKQAQIKLWLEQGLEQMRAELAEVG